MLENKHALSESGYVLLKQRLSAEDIELLELSNSELYQQAQNILDHVKQDQITLPAFYRQHLEELIVVPEIDNPKKVCRYEYIKGSNSTIRDRLVPKLQSMIHALTGQDFVLFKDKCNAKNPGGGAFEPHQDVIAYDKFKPNYHVTVAIFLDEATLENGCLYFPENYRRDLKDVQLPLNKTLAGGLPVLPSYSDGKNNGNIKDEITEKIIWQPVVVKPGDVVIFDSYVPHFSHKNESKKTRRAMFFTFNAAVDGDYYEDYYRMKHIEFDNPAFHIATPTAHSLNS